MCTYKKLLKILLHNFYQSNINDCFNEEVSSLLSQKDGFKALVILSAKGLVVYQTDIYGKVFNIQITGKGFTYFDDMKEQRFRFWFPIIISDLIALLALIMAILAYIKQ